MSLIKSPIDRINKWYLTSNNYIGYYLGIDEYQLLQTISFSKDGYHFTGNTGSSFDNWIESTPEEAKCYIKSVIEKCYIVGDLVETNNSIYELTDVSNGVFEIYGNNKLKYFAKGFDISSKKECLVKLLDMDNFTVLKTFKSTQVTHIDFKILSSIAKEYCLTNELINKVINFKKDGSNALNTFMWRHINIPKACKHIIIIKNE